jgi:hypothetical protein
MHEKMDEILGNIHELEDKLEQELEQGRKLYGFHFKGKVAAFEQDVIEKHNRLRMGLIQYLKESPILDYMTSPIIYSLLMPLVLTDIWVTLYVSYYS